MGFPPERPAKSQQKRIPLRSDTMRKLLSLALGMICSTAAMSAQTADELVGKNLEAKG